MADTIYPMQYYQCTKKEVAQNQHSWVNLLSQKFTQHAGSRHLQISTSLEQFVEDQALQFVLKPHTGDTSKTFGLHRGLTKNLLSTFEILW